MRVLFLLLQVVSSSLPTTQQRYCYPSGTCSLDQVSNGVSGFNLQGDQDSFGVTVSTCGDINCDGKIDFMVGAFQSVPPRVYVVFGSDTFSYLNGSFNVSNFIDGQKGFVLNGEPNDETGGAVAPGGDINGDGCQDLIIGARRAVVAGNSEFGKTYVIFGSPAWGNGTFDLQGLADGTRGFVLKGESPFSGAAVNAGDLDGDGFGDLIVGAGMETYLIFGSNASDAWSEGTFGLGNLSNGQRGFTVTGEAAGKGVSLVDVNGDGLSDMIIGVPNGTAGSVAVVFGARNRSQWGNGKLALDDFLDGYKGFLLKSDDSGDWAGFSVGSAGDVNSDGLSDIVAGAFKATVAGQREAGEVYIIFGNNQSNGWSANMTLSHTFLDGERGVVLQGDFEGDQAGISVGTAGDLNRDGVDDIIIGARGAAQGVGRTYIIFGSTRRSAWGTGVLSLRSLIDGERGFELNGATADNRSGEAVGIAGDIDQDGFDDFMSGAPASGRAYVMLSSRSKWYFTANNLRLAAGDTILLTLQNLNVWTNESGADVNSSYFTVRNVTNGFFASLNNLTLPLSSFYLENIIDGQIYFVHNGGALAPQYSIIIGLHWFPCVYSHSEVTFLGYAPILLSNQLHVIQGLAQLIQSSELSASDQDDPPSRVYFVINDLLHGNFQEYADQKFVNTSRFSLQAVLDRRVQFVADGSPNIPSFRVSVTDGRSETAYQTAIVTFSYAPQLIVPSTLTFDEDTATGLSPRSIVVFNNETFTDDLIIQITNVTGGYFAYTNTRTEIFSFRQVALATGLIRFIQNNSDTALQFLMRVSNGLVLSAWISPPVKLNHRPRLIGKPQDQVVTQGDNFRFSLPQIFDDPDPDDREHLFYTATLQGGAQLPSKIKFTSPNIFEGNLPTATALVIEVQASDLRGLAVSATFRLVSEEPTLDFKTLYSTASGILGGAATLFAWFWLRQRITQHRRDFPFANRLRKVLNLSYYDFSRFSGDTYKTKVEVFLLRLQLEHQDFYTFLTPDEKKIFAVCVAEIVTKRGLVSRSGNVSGLFGIFCCLNVGWSTELNLKIFDANATDIAAQAVAEWTVVAAEDRNQRWTYYSPKKAEKWKVFFCCEKPSSRDRWFVGDGVALTDLKKRSQEGKLHKESAKVGAGLERELESINERLDALESRCLLP